MTGGRPSRGASSGRRRAPGRSPRRLAPARGVGSVLSCRPPSRRSSSVGSPGREPARAGRGSGAGQRAAPGWRYRCQRVSPPERSEGPSRRTPGGGRPAALPSTSSQAVQVPVERGVLRGPRRAHLDVDRVLGAGEVAEPRGRRPGDRAADGGVLRAGLGQGVGEPAPGDLGEHRVVDELLVGLGREVADAARGAVPGLVARRGRTAR